MNHERFQLLWLLGEHAREKGQAETAQQFYKAALAERGLDLEAILNLANESNSAGDDHLRVSSISTSSLIN